MQKKRKKKNDVYKGYKITIISLAIVYTIFIAIMTLLVEDKDIFFTICGILGLCIVLVSLLFGLTIFSGESDKNSIRILELDFDDIATGMDQLLNIMPTVFTHCNHINTYVYNLHDKCYYEIYIKDEIKWMRNIGARNPREKYYYGF